MNPKRLCELHVGGRNMQKKEGNKKRKRRDIQRFKESEVYREEEK